MTIMRASKIRKLIIPVLIFGFAVSPVFAANNSKKSNLRYVIKNDTVFDKKTELTWQRCSVGQRWKKGIGCAGIIQTFTFTQAQQLGDEKWRVPTKEELSSLIDPKRSADNQIPAVDNDAFPDMDSNNLSYWSSTTDGVVGGWYVPFDGAPAYTSSLTSATFAVRLVRSGK